MIYFVVSREHSYTLEKYFRLWGGPVSDIVRIFPITELKKRERIPSGHYILTDFDRFSTAERHFLRRMWQKIDEARDGSRVFNHPMRVRLRYELLRELFERGINDFDAGLIIDKRMPERFPVIIRSGEHVQETPPVVRNETEFRKVVARLEETGCFRDDVLAIGYCDTRDSDGYYRKYSALLINDEIIPVYLAFSKHWFVKHSEYETIGEKRIEEELAYLRDNPHACALRSIFDIANIDYGRIDYGFKDGRLQVWEINTNPGLVEPNSPPDSDDPRSRVSRLFAERFNAVLHRLNNSRKQPGAAHAKTGTLPAGR